MDQSGRPHPRNSQPFVLHIESPQKQLVPTAPLRAGDLCPVCSSARLEYDGLLNLTCPQCSYSVGGGCHT